MTPLLALAACSPSPPTREQAESYARALSDPIEAAEAAVATEVDARFDRFVCRPPDGTFQRQDSPVCIEQKGQWERARLGAITALGPVLEPLLSEQIVGVGVLVVGAGQAAAGERPTPAVDSEVGPRVEARWVGWGADRRGPFIETLRKMTVDDQDIAIRIVARPPAP